MKKIFQILFVLFVSSQLAFGQGTDPVFHFGLKVVPNLGWIKTDDKDIKSDGSKFGFNYGLVTEFRFAENYAFVTGLDVSYRNAKTKGSSTDTAVAGGVTTTTTVVAERSMKVQYIELPLTLKFKTNEIGYLRYFLQVGVAPGFKIRARADDKIAIETNTAGTVARSTEEVDNKDIKDDINNLNMSMIISGGVEYNISGNTNLVLGLVFNNGFSDIADGEFNAKSNFFGLSIGILF